MNKTVSNFVCHNNKNNTNRQAKIRDRRERSKIVLEAKIQTELNVSEEEQKERKNTQ